jgi:hypothetical protein
MSKPVKLKRRGRPATGRDPILGLRPPNELRGRIDAWAAKQADKPRRSEAIRRLVELGLAASPVSMGPVSRRTRAKAVDLAKEAIERRADPSATHEERESRKRRLIKGPKEFRGIRKDRPD